MKKILNILLILAVTAVYTSCKNEVDDVFDKPSAQRMTEALAADKQLLVSAPNGWLMTYYGNTTYGGHSVYLKFGENDMVTVYTEKGGVNGVTSHYKLEQSNGAILSFDEYNELFHYFSAPANPDGKGTAGKGMEGDLEFRIMSATAEKFEMKGKKHGSLVTMTQAPAGFDWSNYFAAVNAVAASFTYSLYDFNVGEQVFKSSFNAANRTFTVTTFKSEEEEITEEVPFIVTDKGLEFYKPLVLNGKPITGVSYNPDLVEDAEVWTAMNDASITITPTIPPINQQLVDGLWATSFSNLGAFGQTYWSYMRDNVLPTINTQYPGTVTYFYFGKLNANYWGAVYRLVGYQGINGFKYRLIGEDEIALIYNNAGNNSNANLFTGSGFLYAAGYLIAPFGSTYQGNPVERVFKLETDNLKSPSYILMTDEENPENTIRLLWDDIDSDDMLVK